jgi:hypothetical protein
MTWSLITAVRRLFMARSTLPIVVMLGAVLILEGVPAIIGDASVTASSARIVPVSSVRLVCPASASSRATTDIAVMAAPVPDSSAMTQSAPDPSVTEASAQDVSMVRGVALIPSSIAGDEELLAEQILPGLPADIVATGPAVRVVSAPGALPLVIEGSGALAPFTDGASSALSRRGDDRGLAERACESPATSWWFVGAASVLGHNTRIVLTNADDAPASLDIRVFGESGLLSAPGGRGVVVAARTRTELRLEELAPGAPITAIHVRANSGRVHAGVLKRIVDGAAPVGSEWLPRIVPQNRAMIPVPSGVNSLDLVLMAVADKPTRVDITVRTTEGEFTPLGLESLELSADTVVRLALDDALTGGGVIDINSDVGIVATVVGRVDARAGLGDLVAFGSAPAVAVPGVITGLRVEGTHRLQLATAGMAGVVDIITIGPDGAQVTSEVRIPDTGVASVTLPTMTGSGAGTVIVLPRVAVVVTMTTTLAVDDGVLASGRTLRVRSSNVTRPEARAAIGLRLRNDTGASGSR